MRLYSLIPVLLCFSCTLQAEIYAWVDENGVKHFSDKKPSAEVQQRNSVKAVKYKALPPVNAVSMPKPRPVSISKPHNQKGKGNAANKQSAKDGAGQPYLPGEKTEGNNDKSLRNNQSAYKDLKKASEKKRDYQEAKKERLKEVTEGKRRYLDKPVSYSNPDDKDEADSKKRKKKKPLSLNQRKIKRYKNRNK